MVEVELRPLPCLARICKDFAELLLFLIPTVAVAVVAVAVTAVVPDGGVVSGKLLVIVVGLLLLLLSWWFKVAVWPVILNSCGIDEMTRTLLGYCRV